MEKYKLPAMLSRYHLIIIFILLLTFACSEPTGNSNDINTDTKSNKILKNKKEFTLVDTSRTNVSNGHFQYVPTSDSTSLIKWGNDNVSNISSPFLNDDLDDRVGVSWQTKKYIALRRSTGSDTWYEIILPLVSAQKEKLFYNPLAYDKKNDIVIYEYNFGSVDTVLVAENILNNKRQYIGKNWKACSSVFNHYCIDSISISNKLLYVKWTLPNKIEEPNKTEIK